MKKIIAIVALIASSQASAFWGWDNSDSASKGNSQGTGQLIGDASAEAEIAFDFSFTGRGKTAGWFQGNGNNGNNWNGYGYQSTPYYQGYPLYGAPVAQ